MRCDDFDQLNDLGITYLQALKHFVKLHNKFAKSINRRLHRAD